jgi:hypothetical protein
MLTGGHLDLNVSSCQATRLSNAATTTGVSAVYQTLFARAARNAAHMPTMSARAPRHTLLDLDLQIRTDIVDENTQLG